MTMYGIHGKKYTLHQFDLPQISNFKKREEKKSYSNSSKCCFYFCCCYFYLGKGEGMTVIQQQHRND